MTPFFIYCCCQLGAEKALKEEIAASHPDLRFAFSRPGFVTFKSARPLPLDFELASVFARTWGFSIGRQDSLASAVASATSLAQELSIPGFTLHCWETDRFPVGEESKGFVPGERARAQELAFRDQAKDLILDPSEWVLDLIVIPLSGPEAEASGPDELCLGFHRTRKAPAFPGGAIPVEMPGDSPSRAFIKLEQALQWAGLSPREGDTALEIGSAPGGASYALLLRGLQVIGIDPGEMAPLFNERYASRFRHLAKPVSQISGREIDDKIDWLILDINAKPLVTLELVEELLAKSPSSFLRLKGMVLTLKINDWKLARFIPEWIARVQAMASGCGLTQVRARQLPANRQEICVVARRRRA